MTANTADTDASERIFKVLAKYLIADTARTVLVRTEQLKGKAASLDRTSLPGFFQTLEVKAREVLADRSAHARLQGDLRFELSALMSRFDASSLEKDMVPIKTEWDVNFARSRAREIATALGSSSVQVVKIMTLVSELARNIVLYTPGGRIEFTPFRDPKRLLIIAMDEGSGIPNLKEVLSGSYRSRTGLGKGIIGTQRLSDRFVIASDKNGTRIEAEVRI